MEAPRSVPDSPYGERRRTYPLIAYVSTGDHSLSVPEMAYGIIGGYPVTAHVSTADHSVCQCRTARHHRLCQYRTGHRQA
eukprot:3229149-Rhodomonas_salina.2